MSEIGNAVAAIKGTMLQAHLAWAKKELESLELLRTHLDEESSRYINRSILATEWIPLRCLLEIDRAIAKVVGGKPEEVYRKLGHYSAFINLNGIYKRFIADEPHRFFVKCAILHEQYQNFGRSTYEKLGERAGRIKVDRYSEYSPIYCGSAVGYYEEALRLMKAPGPILVVEKTCQCWGQTGCLFELTW